MAQEKVEKGKRIKVVIDTNVLISSMLGKDSKPVRILGVLEGENILSYTSKEIIAELRDVMSRQKIREITTEQERHKLIHIIETLSILIEPKVKVDVIKEDLSYNKFLECAISGKADYLISGDKHLLNLGE